MNTPFNADDVLDCLAATRKIFHSEADLQFAFAWAAKILHSSLEVRLETHPTRSESLDLLLLDPPGDFGMAIEFKYKTGFWEGTCNSEEYALKSQGASDIGCYDIVKDITRVERFIDAQDGWSGYVILLTNDSTYWKPRNHGRPTNAEAFRVSEGMTLSGTRQWGLNTGGTNKGREQALQLRGTYNLSWRDYSRIGEEDVSNFRALVIPIK